ncbi:HDOD domain-containing protein [Oleiharenicola sp. Vm1]|uniref:HDOD domain-containing protein n=1 Tax=Oleiharenicola sp. Vm1 TaxID=3398393 RepID=UPI0039F4EB96
MISAPISEKDLQAVAARLPTAPRLLVELGQLMNDPGADATDVVGLLRRDPPLVAQIIRMANSAAYAPSEPIGSLERAIAFVGFVEVHRLVGVVANAQLAEQRLRLYPFDAAHLRQNTLFVAVLMEELAKPAGERPRSCYTVGLLRTIGMMALERLAPAGAAIPPFRESGETALDVWEQKHWSLTNVEAAEKILLHWRLPHETVSAIRHHYHPAGKHNPIIHLLKLAATAASDRFGGLPGEEGYWQLTSENFTKAGVAERDFRIACERAQVKFEQLKAAVA